MLVLSLGVEAMVLACPVLVEVAVLSLYAVSLSTSETDVEAIDSRNWAEVDLSLSSVFTVIVLDPKPVQVMFQASSKATSESMITRSTENQRTLGVHG